MTTTAPFMAAMKEMNSVMDEMEKLLAKKQGVPPAGSAEASPAWARR